MDYHRMLEFTKTCFEVPDQISFWIASINNRDVGFATLTFELDHYSDDTFSSMHGIFVQKDYRGKRAFSSLMNQCILFAKGQGHRGIKLQVHPTNLLSKEIFGKLGFKLMPCQFFASYFLESHKNESVDHFEINYKKHEEIAASAIKTSGIQAKENLSLIEIQKIDKQVLLSTQWPEMHSVVRQSDSLCQQGVNALVNRYLERSYNSGSCLAITKTHESSTQIVGFILTVDEMHNWGPLRSWTTVPDFLFCRELFQDTTSSDSEATKVTLLQVYLKFLDWLKKNDRIEMHWTIDNYCQENSPLCQTLTRILRELSYVENDYECMVLELI